MFSTVTGVFHASLSFCANRRAVMSVALPAVKPTMMRTGLDRRSCARAIRDTDGSAAAPAARWRKFRRGSFILNPPFRFTSLDHLVGAAGQRQRDGDAERPGGLEIDDQLDFRGLHDREVSRLLAFENAPGVDACLPMRLHKTARVTHQAAGDSEVARL